MDQTSTARANIQAATHNSKTNGISIASVADGNIVHSNSIVPEEMVQAMMTDPLALQGHSREQIAPLAKSALTLINA